MTVRWAFWRKQPQELPRALPDDVGLPTRPRPAAAPSLPDPDDREPSEPVARTSGAIPSSDPGPSSQPSLAAPSPGVDRTAVAAAGGDLSRIVSAVSTGTPVDLQQADARTLAVAATGALADRLPALSGAAGSDDLQDELLDELLHAYAELLATRAQDRPHADREDLLAVAHLAAAAAAVDAAADPALLLLAGVPADVQLRAAALLLAQTADDGGGVPGHLPREVRALFAAPG